ncbi:hypothetical protein C3747_18g215 [Trypanosoma cruzi]|uniref:Dephospho-CoA kinase n=1 Tax=Trypanosoma cruzi TaxID=5693 RepID=A0A2V2X9L1_TRYCR|nr:hypothetical protein C3747_18g215 [Trypanosoma cruzi]
MRSRRRCQALHIPPTASHSLTERNSAVACSQSHIQKNYGNSTICVGRTSMRQLKRKLNLCRGMQFPKNKSVLLIILEAALLTESSLLSLCDDVWIMTCAKGVAVRRVMDRNDLTEAQAEARVESQGSVEKKLDFLKNIKFKGEVLVFDTTNDSLEEGLKRVTIAFDEYWCRKLEPLQKDPDEESSPW